MEELVSASEGSEDSVHICGVEAGKSTSAVRDVVSGFDVVDCNSLGYNIKATTAIDNGNDNDNDNHTSTTSHAQRHGLEDMDAGRRKTFPGRFPHEPTSPRRSQQSIARRHQRKGSREPADLGQPLLTWARSSGDTH